MFVHMVCFKYKADVDEAKREDHRRQLRGLASIDLVVDLKVGADVLRTPRSYDAGLILTVRDRAAYDAYVQHPQHKPVLALGPVLCESIVAVDYEI